MFIRFFVSCFFLLLLSFFLLLMNFFNSIISAESRHGHLLIYTNIFSVFFVIRCHAAPYIFFLHFILFNSKALEFFFFLSLQCPAMVFAQIGGAVPNAGAFSFIFPQKSRSHWIIQHIYRILQETMNTVIRRTSYKSRDVDRILLLKKIILPLSEIIFFYKRFHRISARILFSNFLDFHSRYFFSLLNEKKSLKIELIFYKSVKKQNFE